ncbi:MAG: rhomboid family intramembrane serine protease [Steroidobacteraceae bacterium]
MIPLKGDLPSSRKPVVTVSLIAACAGVFLWQRSLDAASGRQAVAALGAIPAVLLTDARLPPDLSWIPRFASPFTSMFLHGGWMHLLGNMLFLWIFGDNVEDALGHGRYLLFYLLCGIAALFAQALSNPTSPYPIIGASGAISGVLGAYLLLFPRTPVLTLVLLPFYATTLAVQARLLLLLWFAVQLLSDRAVPDGGAGIAFRAHIGGFLTGMLLALLLKRYDKVTLRDAEQSRDPGRRRTRP